MPLAKIGIQLIVFGEREKENFEVTCPQYHLLS